MESSILVPIITWLIGLVLGFMVSILWSQKGEKIEKEKEAEKWHTISTLRATGSFGNMFYTEKAFCALVIQKSNLGKVRAYIKTVHGDKHPVDLDILKAKVGSENLKQIVDSANII